MLSFLKKDRRSETRKEYDRAVCELKSIEDQTSEEYNNQLKVVERLKKLITDEEFDKSRKKPTPDAVLAFVGTIATGAFWIAFEREHVITGKIWNVLPKFKFK